MGEWLTPLLVAALLSAGCLGVGGPDGTGSATGTSEQATNVTDGTGEGTEDDEEAPALDTPAQQTWYLTSDLGYDTDPGVLGDGARVMLDPLTDGLMQGELTKFVYTRPADATTAFVVTDASLTLHYTRDTPGVADAQYPAFGAFWGVGEGTSLLSLEAGPAAVGAEDVVEVTLTFEVPPGGLVFPPGTTIWTTIFGAYHPSDEGANAGYVIVGDADRPTRFDGTYFMTAWPEVTGETSLLSETGSLQGGECTPAGGSDESRATHTFEVEPGVIGVEASLTRTGGQGQFPDIDFSLLGPADQVVATGRTPYAEEVASAYLPNIEAVGTGTWSVVVNVCNAQTAEYAVEVTGLVAAEASDEEETVGAGGEAEA